MNEPDGTSTIGPKGSDSDETSIARLIRLAGPRSEVAGERGDRVRGAVHEQWRAALADRAEIKPRKQTAWLKWAAGGLAAALAVGIGVRLLQPAETVIPVPLATVTVTHGGVQAGSGDAGLGTAGPGLALGAGDVLVTGAGSGAALSLDGGRSLRIDESSRFMVLAENSFRLVHGAIYFDSGSGEDTAAIAVETEFGIARDMGTQFELRVDPDSMRLRVREGLVEVSSTPAAPPQRALQGEELRLDRSGELGRSRVSLHGPAWSWTSRLNEGFDLEGQTLGRFLSWITRENGWTLELADEDLARRAAANELHGSIEGLAPREALDAVMTITRLEYQLRDGVLTIRSPDAAQ